MFEDEHTTIVPCSSPERVSSISTCVDTIGSMHKLSFTYIPDHIQVPDGWVQESCGHWMQSRTLDNTTVANIVQQDELESVGSRLASIQ